MTRLLCCTQVFVPNLAVVGVGWIHGVEIVHPLDDRTNSTTVSGIPGRQEDPLRCFVFAS